MFGLDNFLVGAGAKVIGNVINHWFENSSEERKNNALRDAEVLKAHVELAKINNGDWIFKASRGIVFGSITFTFCYITIYSMCHPEQTSVLIDVDKGFLSQIFRQESKVVKEINSSGFVFQKCFAIMEAVIGAFVMPSRRK